MQYHHLTDDAPFGNLEISRPEKLESGADYSQLVQHMVSCFRLELNECYRKQGYEARQNILSLLVLFLHGIMPLRYPEYVADYPDSLDSIYATVSGILRMYPGRLTPKKKVG